MPRFMWPYLKGRRRVSKIQDLMPIVNAKIISNGSSFTYEIEIIAPDGQVIDSIKQCSKRVFINRDAAFYEIKTYINSFKEELAKGFKISQKEFYLKGSIYDA